MGERDEWVGGSIVAESENPLKLLGGAFGFGLAKSADP